MVSTLWFVGIKRDTCPTGISPTQVIHGGGVTSDGLDCRPVPHARVVPAKPKSSNIALKVVLS